MNFRPVEEQLEVIKRGVVDLVDEDDLRKRLQQSRDEDRPLRVKFGIDPSSPDIHLGHTVPLRKLRDFQQLGHRVIVLWGTTTAMVGDPTGRNKTRPALTREQVEANKQTYREQIGAVLDVDNIEERENGEWFLDAVVHGLRRRSPAATPSRACSNATTSPSATKPVSRSRCTSSSTRCCRAGTRSS